MTTLAPDVVPENTLGQTIIFNEAPSGVEVFISGTENDDVLLGDDCSDSKFAVSDVCSSSLKGLAGNDQLLGGGEFDILRGGSGDDLLRGGSGPDRFFGGSDRDRLWGGKDNDNLRGGSHNDKLRGGGGDDLLRGDGGRDRLWGGKGRDAFMLQPGQGIDRIMDYKDGTDRLGLDDTTHFEDLQIIQRGSKTIIFHDDERLAVLVNVDTDVITASDFGRVIFAV